MKKFNVPEMSQVPIVNQKTLASFEKAIGFIPNVYAFMAHSTSGLSAYLDLSKKKLDFSPQEREVISLTASEIRKCMYCLSAHSQSAKGVGFTDAQILEIRAGKISFDAKLATLAAMTKSLIINNGNADSTVIDAFYAHGYTDAHLVDLTLAIAIITITNYINNATHIPVDFPLAADL